MIFKRQVKVLCFIVILSTLNVFADKKEVSLLFVGETGTGKSTCINYIYNLVLGRNFEDSRDIIIPLLDGSKEYHVNVDEYQDYNVELQKAGSSQTKEVHLYTVENDEYKVNMWDTPGFQDTINSQEREAEITKSIVDAVSGTSSDENEAKSQSQSPDPEIHAIVIVMRATDSRLYQSVINAMKSIKTMLPKSFKDNLILLYTYPKSMSPSQRENLPNKFKDVLLFDLGIQDQSDSESNNQGIPSNMFTLEAFPFFNDPRDPSLGDYEFNYNKVLWEDSRQKVNKLLSFAASLKKVDGEKIGDQHSKNEQANTYAKEALEKAKDYLANYNKIVSLGIELEKEKKVREDNRYYTKKERREWTEYKAQSFWDQLFGAPPVIEWLHFDDVEVVDETKKNNYETAKESVGTINNEINKLTGENKKNEQKREENLKELSKIREDLKEDAWGMNADPYLVKIKKILESADITGDEVSKEYYEKLKAEYLKKYYPEFKEEL